LPLRSELAMTFTDAIPFWFSGPDPVISGRTILNSAGFASPFRIPDEA
jgi:hypothetical protein